MDRRSLLGAVGAMAAGIAAAVRSYRSGAQEATPAASPVATPVATPVTMVNAVLIDADQRRLGIATLSEGAGGTLTVNLDLDPGALPAGQYGLYLRETGICQPAADVPFAAAGGIIPGAETGKLGEATVEADTPVAFTAEVDTIALGDLSDRDGSALVLHQGDEELVRVGCGVVFPPVEAAAATPAASPAATPGAATPVADGATEVTVALVDIAFDPGELTIPAGTEVTVRLPNHGATVHNFHIDALDVHSEDVPPGGEGAVTIVAEAGEYEYYCSVPGHREAGMVGTLRVE